MASLHKYLIAFCIALLVLPLGQSALCQTINPITNVPCTIVTPVLYCSSNAVITDLNQSINYSLPMTSRGDGTYEFQFNYGINEYSILLCDNTTTTLSITPSTTQAVYYPITQSYASQRITIPNENYTIAVQVSQYPYIDFNTTATLYVDITQNGTAVSNLNASLFITELNNSITQIAVPFNNATQVYQISMLFNEIGNFPFRLEVSGALNQNLTSGTFYVRQPFYVYAKLFKQKDLSDYRNNYGYVTAEFTTTRDINPYIEPFIHSISDARFRQPVFHANYIDGVAKLKLYENASYIYRFSDGITFNSTYSQPIKEKILNNEMYLGQLYTNQSTTYQFVLNSREITQWEWLFNWLFIIGIILVAIGSVALFFKFPNIPWISFVFGILFGGLIIIARIILYIWRFLE